MDAQRTCFYSGTETDPIYVDDLPPAPGKRTDRLPVVMVHGGAHTGTCWLVTPDERPGWAPYFAATGRRVLVPDWPSHGRSPIRPDFATLSVRAVVASLRVLLDEIGPAILLVHSAGGPIAWTLAEQSPDKVAAIVGVAPGPPSNLQRELPDDPDVVNALRYDESLGCPVYCPEDKPLWIGRGFIADYWANSPRFPRHALDQYARSIVPESARLMNERFNINGAGLRIGDPAQVGSRPILVVTGDRDPRHPRAVDEAVATYLGAEFVWLADRGIAGNGHMLMIEDNSLEIADLILGWLERKGL